ncbi:MAG: thioredoxin domain-containing protein [Tepidanaerobacteraceae bacterium]
MNTKQRYTNKLISEKSPYLLQHAHNPVDWFPWGDEAFEKAKGEEKPIFLSIGYSTCHWCHVMERESFEDEEVAAILNQHFVAIKVDREERPDLDTIYMRACQAMTGQGGWPLTIVMSPDKKPFFAGTYFPKESKWGRPGIIDILHQLSKAWHENRGNIDSIGDRVTQILQTQYQGAPGELRESVIDKAFEEFFDSFDDQYGGFGSAPKFPTPHNLLFLLRYWHKTGDEKALELTEKTLGFMARGGVFDHIGFGFHRYSTDRKWLVPHFEKMLYDNALLAYVLVEAYEATGNKTYKETAQKIFSYVIRDMTSPEGGFYSAEDADSEGVEGKFYVWTPEEVIGVLGPEDGKWFCDIFDISSKGNFEGKSIPNLIKSGIVENDRVNRCREKLFWAREKRIHPHKDDKILTSWNGLMIAALSKGARVFNDEKLSQISERAVNFILEKLIDKDGRLLARYRDGHAAFMGYLDDYVFLVWGLLELYETNFKVEYLRQALMSNQRMLDLFWDEDKGGLFFYGKDSEELIVRSKEVYDGAIPSGNSVAALNLLKLSRMTGDAELSDKAWQLFSTFAGTVLSQPSAHAFLLTALLFALDVPKEIVIVGDSAEEDTRALIKKVRSHYMPNAITVFHSTSNQDEQIGELIPFVKEMRPKDEKATVYVCENYACKEPTTDLKRLGEILEGKIPARLK